MIEDLRVVRKLRSHVGAVLCVRYTVDGSYCLSCGADRSVKLWNPHREAPETGALLIKTYAGPHMKEVSAVAVADDSARFASCGGDTTAFVWDVATGAVVRRLEGHGARINCAVFCGPGHCVLATGSYDQAVKLWDLRSQTRHALQTIDEFGDSVTSVAVATRSDPQAPAAARPKRPGARRTAPECGLVAASVDGTVRTFDLRRGCVHEDSVGVPVTSVSVSRDGACLAASCLDGSARLLELDSGLQLNLYTGHAHAKYALESTFSHNDAYLASGSEDGNAKVWRLVEASVAADLKGAHATAATSLAWHPSRASVLLAAFDGTVSLWEPPAGPS